MRSTYLIQRLQKPRGSDQFARSLRPFDEWDGETCGWLELDNGFMFFSDREMWERPCALFGVTIDVSA